MPPKREATPKTRLYGLFSSVLKSILLPKPNGDRVWRKAVKASRAPEEYMVLQPIYDEDDFLALLGACVKQLGTTQNALLEEMGNAYIPFLSAKQEFAVVMQILGPSFLDALLNINGLLMNVRSSHCPMMGQSHFQCEVLSHREARLIYRPSTTVRQYLAPFLAGILHNLAESRYHLKGFAQSYTLDGADTVVFMLSWDAPASASTADSTDTGGDTESSIAEDTDGSEGIDARTLAYLYPFYFCLDRSGRFLQAGRSLVKLVPLVRVGERIDDLISVVSPSTTSGQFLVPTLRRHQSEQVILSVTVPRRNVPKARENVHLHGQFVYVRKDKRVGRLFFFGTPRFDAIEDVYALGLSLGDFSVNDNTVSTLLIKANQIAEEMLAHAERKPKPSLFGKKQSSKLNDAEATSVSAAALKTGSSSATAKRTDSSDFDADGSAVSGSGGGGGGGGGSRSERVPESMVKLGSNKTPSTLKSTSQVDGVKSPSSSAVSIEGETSGHSLRQASDVPVPMHSRLAAELYDILLDDRSKNFSMAVNLALAMFANSEVTTDESFPALVSFYKEKSMLFDLMQHMLAHEIKDEMDGHRNTMLRSDTASTRLCITYIRLECHSWLQSWLKPTLRAMNKQDKDFKPEAIEAIVMGLLSDLRKALPSCPSGVISLLQWVGTTTQLHAPQLSVPVVCSFLFLRYIGPALITPTHYGLPAHKKANKLSIACTKFLQNQVSALSEEAGSQSVATLPSSPSSEELASPRSSAPLLPTVSAPATLNLRSLVQAILMSPNNGQRSETPSASAAASPTNYLPTAVAFPILCEVAMSHVSMLQDAAATDTTLRANLARLLTAAFTDHHKR